MSSACHCDGTGPNQFNALAALERWREQNVLQSIKAAKVNERGGIDITRLWFGIIRG
jgi:hypothetical protein